DPLSTALQPPLGETPQQKKVRLKAENEATMISTSIDSMLKEEIRRNRLRRPQVNVLLLGQSESGKS
ncbi:hypothetical protein BDQ17DRAFT_1212289, partial [Cyathus striatus]